MHESDDRHGVMTPGIRGAVASPAHRRGRARWATLAAGAWSLAYAAAGLYWASGGAGFPYGESARARRMGAVLVGLDPRSAGTAVAVAGLAGAVAAAVAYRTPPSEGRRGLRGLAWSIGLVLLLLVPDGRVLLGVGELMLLDAGRLEAGVVNQLWCALGGVLWVCVAVLPRRRPSAITTEDLRRGRRTTYVAAALPLLYAVPRLLWALGVTFGLDEETMAMAADPAGRTRELVFGAAAAGGGLLTLGLTHRWGVRFPRMVPLLGGRRVPVTLAAVPAGLVSVVLVGAGFTMWRVPVAALLGTRLAGEAAFGIGNWAAWLGNLVWLPWGVMLGLAVLAYTRRRKGTTG
ncbi:hypothetical protein ACIBCT_25660 [Streptosporangium sp. NPDC050855]|uniref:hypothetical protein n=1 Tax=Streptosporangium sp. NPDC050855 TaxID=3366194 RepID=UPI0037AB5557